MIDRASFPSLLFLSSRFNSSSGRGIIFCSIVSFHLFTVEVASYGGKGSEWRQR